MTKDVRLKKWCESLSKKQLQETLIKCVDELIDFEYISFYKYDKVPYWDGNGENIDGTENKK